MESSKNPSCEELHLLQNKLNLETAKLVRLLEERRKTGEDVVKQAESIICPKMRQITTAKAVKVLQKLLESSLELTSTIESMGHEVLEVKIPYPSPMDEPIRLTFSSGDSPWNFWLVNDSVDTKTIQKNLLDKYMNGLLQPNLDPKASDSVCFIDRNKVFRGVVLQALKENRVKILDCDSNMVKIITREKIFKADPDACEAQASFIKCTISKDQTDSYLWNSEISDVFRNALKEAVLSVRVIEQLTDSYPTFVVHVTMENEEENSVGFLQQWILERLLPELEKLSEVKYESVFDLINPDVLNPYEIAKPTMSNDNTENASKRNSPNLRENNNLNKSFDQITLNKLENLNTSFDQTTTINKLENLNTSFDQTTLNKLENFTSNESNQVNSESQNAMESRHSEFITPEIKSEEKILNDISNHKEENKKCRHNNLISPNIWGKAKPFIPRLSRQSSDTINYSNTPSYAMAMETLFPSHFPVSQQNQLQAQSCPKGINVTAEQFVPNRTNNDIQRNLPSLPAMESGVSPDHVSLRRPCSLMEPGENLLAMISHVVSPTEFYVHLITKNNMYLDKLQDSMFKYYNNTKQENYPSWVEAKEAIGNFCACLWEEDKKWYRAEVKDWNWRIKVYFVDYGNTCTVALNSIKPLHQKFSKLSMAAQPCQLAHVLPLQKNSPWSDQSIEFFKETADINDTKVYSIVVVPVKRELPTTNSLSVLLYKGKASEDKQSINEQMVEQGLAWSKYFKRSEPKLPEISHTLDDSASQQSEAIINNSSELTLAIAKHDQDVDFAESWEKWDPLSEDYNSARNNPAIDTGDAGVALTGYKAKDEERICQFYAQEGVCYKLLCEKEHIRPNPDGVTTDKTVAYHEAFTDMTLPAVGTTVKVLVTSVTSVDLFFVQFPESQGQIDTREDSHETLTSLLEFMNQPESVLQMKFLNVLPALGQLVIAKWENQWYRARIFSHEEDNVEVMFVDYGSITCVPDRDLREMEPRYLHLPFQAVECALANVLSLPDDSEDYEKANKQFRDLVEGQKCTALIYKVPNGGPMEEPIRIYLKGADQRDIGFKLLGMGLARSVPSN